MAPVIQLETRSDANVEIDANNNAKIEGGKVDTKVKIGMNENGEVGAGLELDKTANLIIDGGKVKLGTGTSSKTRETSNRDNASSPADTGIIRGIY